MTTVEKYTENMSIDRDAVLKTLNLNPRDPNTQALLLVCDRYNLDPLLKHIVLISGNAYVTRDGYLAIAHASGKFDGIEVVETGETASHYTAKVAVYRKDMGRPFVYVGRYPKAQRMAKDYGPEMAVKVAEVQALRRAFNVTGVGAADERWDEEAERTLVTPTVAPTPAAPSAPKPAEPAPTRSRVRRPPNVSDDGEIVDAEVVDDDWPKVSKAHRDKLEARVKALSEQWRTAFNDERKEKHIRSLNDPEFSGEDAAAYDLLLTDIEQTAADVTPPLDAA